MRVAVLGMGRMGHALAERLLAGVTPSPSGIAPRVEADDLLARGAAAGRDARGGGGGQ